MPHLLILADSVEGASPLDDEPVREHLQGLLDTREAEGWTLLSVIPQYQLRDERGRSQGLAGPYLVMHRK